jgi:ATP-dependent RNA circularization protein (DNA/RNA ligase family)
MNKEELPKKRRQSNYSINLIERVTALENISVAQHSEIMRILSDLHSEMREGIKLLTEEARSQALKQVVQDNKIEVATKEIIRIDTKLNKIMGGIGAVAITVVGGIFTVLSRFFGI